MQNDLLPQEVLIEYVLAEPVSYAFAITRTSATPYALSGRSAIEPAVQRYIELISKGNTDTQLAYRLFEKLLRPIRELHDHTSAVFVPDRCLHLLPVAALYDGGRYVLATHTTSIVPAATVFHILRTRARLAAIREPFVGVAPVQIFCEGLKGTHRLSISISRYSCINTGCANIDASRVRV